MLELLGCPKAADFFGPLLRDLGLPLSFAANRRVRARSFPCGTAQRRLSSAPITIRQHSSLRSSSSSEERFVFVRDFRATETTEWHLERQRNATFKAMQEVFAMAHELTKIHFSEELRRDGSGTIVLHGTCSPPPDGVVYFA